MSLPIKISTGAARALRHAAESAAANGPATPDAIQTDFREAVTLLAQRPKIGAEYQGTRTAGVRRLFLNRIRYCIYYQAEGNELKILAFQRGHTEDQPDF